MLANKNIWLNYLIKKYFLLSKWLLRNPNLDPVCLLTCGSKDSQIETLFSHNLLDHDHYYIYLITIFLYIVGSMGIYIKGLMHSQGKHRTISLKNHKLSFQISTMASDSLVSPIVPRYTFIFFCFVKCISNITDQCYIHA